MTYRGVCLDSENAVARPSARRLRTLGVDFARLVAFDTDDFYAYHTYLKINGFKTAIVLTGSSFSTDDYRAESADYARKITPDIWLIANEFDIAGAASWPPGGDDAFVDVWNRAALGIRSVQPAAALYVGGLFDAGNALGRLDSVLPRLTFPPTGIDFHPYTATVGECIYLLGTARARYGCEIGVLEWNESRSKLIAPFVKVLDALTEYSAFIPFSFEQLAGELPGIVKRDRYTAAGRAYRSALKEA